MSVTTVNLAKQFVFFFILIEILKYNKYNTEYKKKMLPNRIFKLN